MRRAARRDANEPKLVKVAKRLGAHWLQYGPLDGWIFHKGNWTPVEIKRPEREGHADEFTPAQRDFLVFARWYSAPWFAWRCEDDVLRDLGARRSA